jgi:hypothetical protein
MADTQTATVEVGAFMRAVTNAALFASTDDTLPTLTSVHFRPSPRAGFLQLEATNRYVASQEDIDLADLAVYDSDWGPSAIADHMETGHGWDRPEAGVYGGKPVPADIERLHAERHEAGDAGHTHSTRPMPETELDVLVNVTDLGKLVKTLKLVLDPGTKHQSGAARPHVVIEHAEDSDRVSFTLINNLGPDTAISPRLVDGEFPPIDALMATAELPPGKLQAQLDKAEQDRQAGFPGYRAEPRPVPDVWERCYLFDAQWLAAFAKVDPGQKNTPVEFRFTATGKPAMVIIGEQFRAMVVPIRGA